MFPFCSLCNFPFRHGSLYSQDFRHGHPTAQTPGATHATYCLIKKYLASSASALVAVCDNSRQTTSRHAKNVTAWGCCTAAAIISMNCMTCSGAAQRFSCCRAMQLHATSQSAESRAYYQGPTPPAIMDSLLCHPVRFATLKIGACGWCISHNLQLAMHSS